MNRLLLLWVFILNSFSIIAQFYCGTTGDEPPGCLVCERQLLGTTDGFTPDIFDSHYPCDDSKNAQWFHFYASSPMEYIIVYPFCYDDRYSFQAVVLDEHFEPLTNCFSINPAPAYIMLENITVGGRYYVVIGGTEGEICDFSLFFETVTFPSPKSTGPITQTPDILPVCLGGTICYSIEPVMNAVYYEWEVPSYATIVSGGSETDTEVCVIYRAPGSDVVKVTPSSHCFRGTTSEKIVIAQPIPATIVSEIICLEDFQPPFPGNFSITYQSYLGCDSVVQYFHSLYPPVPNFIDTTICGGSCLEIAGRQICEAGSSTIVLENATSHGCDSIIEINLSIDADHQAPSWTLDSRPPVWQQGSDGWIDMTVNGIGSYTFSWSNGATTEDIQNLTAGEYCVSVFDDYGCTERECIDLGGGIFRINPIHIICQGKSKQLNIRPSRGADFQWTAAPGLSCTDCSNPIVSPTVSTVYEVKATLPGGRSGTMNVVVIVLPPPFCPNNLNTEGENGWKEVAMQELRAFEEFSSLDKNEIFKLINYENEFSTENFIKVYPNPFRDEVQIESSSDHISQVEIYDLRGRLVYNNNFDSNKISITLNHLNKGSYFIRAKTNNSVFVYKILKT